jgi:ATP-dependent Clp protease ATP-binding subunit ClpA
MDVTTSIEWVWKLAEYEAIAGRSGRIEPDHFFMALLMFAELSAQGLEDLGVGPDIARELAGEGAVVREHLAGCCGDTRRLRRALRARLGKGAATYKGGGLHRSQPSRELFRRACRLASEIGDEALTARCLLAVLLESPTAAMAEVLAEVQGAGGLPAAASRTPLLDAYDAYGRPPPGEGAADGPKDATPAGRAAEVRAVLRALAAPKRRSVLLLTEDDAAARAIAAQAAEVLDSGRGPKSLKGKRIVDVSAVAELGAGPAGAKAALAELLAEAQGQGVILVLPPVEASPGASAADDWPAALRNVLSADKVQCLCRFAPQAYLEWCRHDPAWRWLAEAMWIHDEDAKGLPEQL